MGGSWNDFGREMANFGREMGKLGQELSREISEAVKSAGWAKGANIADDIARRTEEKFVVRSSVQRKRRIALNAVPKRLPVMLTVSMCVSMTANGVWIRSDWIASWIRRVKPQTKASLVR